MGEQHVPLTIDGNGNVTKVGTQLELFPNEIYEDCILCGEKGLMVRAQPPRYASSG